MYSVGGLVLDMEALAAKSGVRGESKAPALNDGDNPRPITEAMYPAMLADWWFHGEHYQAWNQKERMWIVIQKTPVNDMMGLEWELLWSQ